MKKISQNFRIDNISNGKFCEIFFESNIKYLIHKKFYKIFFRNRICDTTNIKNFIKKISKLDMWYSILLYQKFYKKNFINRMCGIAFPYHSRPHMDGGRWGIL